ncbi:hypothetical protein NBRC111894_283 [Sporolactobacillus inulinus]|uniref:Arginine--tRNA ligase n=1 Tax=Sporolactobacillus inulinus TaxID=2078 RepID=A0A4Y1Z6V3_9BACL|nr:hypothetical protein NBRC111894_283 [Sporolactobacillus inulinus]
MTIVEQVKNQLKEEIIQAVIKAELAAPEEMPDVVLETPKDKAHGDLRPIWRCSSRALQRRRQERSLKR